MKFIKTFESYDKSTDEKEMFRRKPRLDAGKRCMGRCDRKVIVKDGRPAIYCSGCDRYTKSL